MRTMRVSFGNSNYLHFAIFFRRHFIGLKVICFQKMKALLGEKLPVSAQGRVKINKKTPNLNHKGILWQ